MMCKNIYYVDLFYVILFMVLAQHKDKIIIVIQ